MGGVGWASPSCLCPWRGSGHVPCHILFSSSKQTPCKTAPRLCYISTTHTSSSVSKHRAVVPRQHCVDDVFLLHNCLVYILLTGLCGKDMVKDVLLLPGTVSTQNVVHVFIGILQDYKLYMQEKKSCDLCVINISYNS